MNHCSRCLDARAGHLNSRPCEHHCKPSLLTSFHLTLPWLLLILTSLCEHQERRQGRTDFIRFVRKQGASSYFIQKNNNTRNLSVNYLYRFNSWLISSSVRNIVSVFATAKQLMFLWFQLYSNSRLFTTKYKLCYKKWYKFYRSARGSARYALVCCYISCPMEAWNEWSL